MKTLIQTGDPATLNFAQALLRDADISCFLFDTHTAAIDGPQGFIAPRLVVDAEDWNEAAEVLRAGGLGREVEM